MKSPQANVYPDTEEEFLTKLHEVIAQYGDVSGGFQAEVNMILGNRSKEEVEDNYSRGAWLMRDVAVLAFNYASNIAGASGFQASIAALEAYGSILGIENFGVFQMDDMLYPQYDLRAKLEDWIKEATPRIQEEARKKLAELTPESLAVKEVVSYWKYLAEGGKP